MTDAEKLEEMAQQALKSAAEDQVLGRTKRVTFYRNRADLFRRAAAAFKATAAAQQTLEKIAASDSYIEMLGIARKALGRCPECNGRGGHAPGCSATVKT